MRFIFCSRWNNLKDPSCSSVIQGEQNEYLVCVNSLFCEVLSSKSTIDNSFSVTNNSNQHLPIKGSFKNKEKYCIETQSGFGYSEY